MGGLATIVCAIVIILLAGVVSGLTGFGFVLVSVTPLLLLFAPTTVVPVTLGLNFLTSAMVAIEARDAIYWRTVFALLPSACVGLYVGALALTSLDAGVIKIVASVVVAGFALLSLTGRRIPGARTRWATVIAGVTSGALTTATGLTGPPIVVLFNERQFATLPFRASAAAYFLPIDILGIVALMMRSGVHRTEVSLALLLAPAALIGTGIGRMLVARISAAAFRRLVLGLLLFTGIIGGATAAAALR